MGNFNKGKSFGGGRGGKKFGGKRDFGGRSSFGGDRSGNRGFGGGRGGDREMHKAVCDDCRKECEVPFRPTGDKPVYCSDCFGNKGGDSSRNYGDRGKRDFGGRNDRQPFDNKRSYQKDGGKSSENYKVQFEQINAKLDKILKVLNPVISEEKKEDDMPKTKKFERAPKKEVETVALKKVITKAINKKPVSKKVVKKKTPTKKSATKKTNAKKVAVKKTSSKNKK